MSPSDISFSKITITGKFVNSFTSFLFGKLDNSGVDGNSYSYIIAFILEFSRLIPFIIESPK